jgi:hypothetical protein
MYLVSRLLFNGQPDRLNVLSDANNIPQILEEGLDTTKGCRDEEEAVFPIGIQQMIGQNTG